MVHMDTAPGDGGPVTRPQIALPEPGYTDLFGVPAGTLRQLHDLRTAAQELRLPVDTWGTERDKLLAGLDVPPDDLLERLRWVIVEQWTDSPGYIGGPSTGTVEGRGATDHLRRLLDDLAVLEGPPSLAAIQDRLAELPEARAWAETQPAERRERTLKRVAHHEQYLRDWLSQLKPDTVPPEAVDPVTGLPLQVLAQHRDVDDSVLGRVPVGRVVARARAYENASEGERREADVRRAGLGLPRYEGSRKLHLMHAELPRETVVEFLRFAYEHPGTPERPCGSLSDDGLLPELLEGYVNLNSPPETGRHRTDLARPDQAPTSTR